MLEFRVTKYNPKNRNKKGHYLITEEWTDFGEVGKNVTLQEYEIVESAYLETAYEFIKEAKISHLKLFGLGNSQNKSPFKEGESISIEQLKPVIKSILRNEYWCRIESDEVFVHVGDDFYMYVGVPSVSEEALVKARARGLFVERWISPYHPEQE
jgi:hypothetical protein